MACCKCCCENGTPPGECCGSPSTCCKEPDICCGPTGSKVCCEDPRVCCGVGSGQECCPEGDLCCNESCCPPERCCGSGAEAVCCNEGQYCCDGVCSDDPCDLCYPCEDCSWPSDRSEGGIACSVSPCCEYPLSLTGSRTQSFTASLPSGISWKDGFPDALDTCNTRWCVDTSVGVCYDSNANVCRFITKTRYRLLALNCSTQSMDDITEDAASGTFETTSSGACTDGPTFPDYFSDATPVCDP